MCAGNRCVAAPIRAKKSLLEGLVVKFTTITGKTTAEGSRAAVGNPRPIHAAATAMKAGFVVPPIIRGYTLRTFVESHSPENRYSDVADWLQLSPLVEVQKNLRLLRRDVKAAAESTTEQDRVAGLLRTETAQAVQAWDDAAVLGFINASVIAPLDPALTLTTLAAGDEGYVEVGKRVEAEEKRVGLAGLKQIRNSVVALWQKTVPEDGGDAELSGAIAAFGKALAVKADAKATEADERGKAAGTVFRSVWKEAEKLFADVATAPDAWPPRSSPSSKATNKARSLTCSRGTTPPPCDRDTAYPEATPAAEARLVNPRPPRNGGQPTRPGVVQHGRGQQASGLRPGLPEGPRRLCRGESEGTRFRHTEQDG